METSPVSLSGEEKLWIVLCHLSPFLGVAFLLPLIVYLVKKSDPSPVAAHAKEALNFHISFFLYGIVALLLVFILIGIPLLVVLGIMVVIFSIMAAIKGVEGKFFRYPITLRLVP